MISHLVVENGSLCSRWSFFITPNLPVLPRPCPYCLCPCWALTAYLPRFLGAGPSFAPFPQADPISIRSQATARSHVGHNNDSLFFTDCSIKDSDELSKIPMVHLQCQQHRQCIHCWSHYRNYWYQWYWRSCGSSLVGIIDTGEHDLTDINNTVSSCIAGVVDYSESNFFFNIRKILK